MLSAFPLTLKKGNTMSHKKPTPEHLRPTLAELEVHEAYQRRNSKLHAVIRGLWDETEEYFEVNIKGDFADVIEVFEMLKDNGNLMGIELHEIRR